MNGSAKLNASWAIDPSKVFGYEPDVIDARNQELWVTQTTLDLPPDMVVTQLDQISMSA